MAKSNLCTPGKPLLPVSQNIAGCFELYGSIGVTERKRRLAKRLGMCEATLTNRLNRPDDFTAENIRELLTMQEIAPGNKLEILRAFYPGIDNFLMPGFRKEEP